MNQDLILFDDLKSSIMLLVQPAFSIAVKDFKDSASAISAAKQVRDYIDRVEAQRKALVGPLNERVKAINAYAKEIAKPLNDAESFLKNELIQFEMEQEKIREAEMARLEQERIKAQRKADAERAQAEESLKLKQEQDSEIHAQAASIFGTEESTAPIEQAMAVEQVQLKEELDIKDALIAGQARQREWDIKQQGLKNVRKTWKCELLDIARVPAAYVVTTLNEPMVLAAARGGMTEIPGVRLYQESSLAIGKNTYVPKSNLK